MIKSAASPGSLKAPKARNAIAWAAPREAYLANRGALKARKPKLAGWCFGELETATSLRAPSMLPVSVARVPGALPQAVTFSRLTASLKTNRRGMLSQVRPHCRSSGSLRPEFPTPRRQSLASTRDFLKRLLLCSAAISGLFFALTTMANAQLSLPRKRVMRHRHFGHWKVLQTRALDRATLA